MGTADRRFWKSWARGYGAALVVGVFLAVSGAFATSQAPFWYRLIYWLTVMTLGTGISGAVDRLFARWVWMDDRPLVRTVLLCLALTLPLTVVIWATTAVFYERPWRLEDLSAYFGPVLSVTAMMTAIGFLLDRPGQTHAAASEASAPRFLDRIPFKLKGAQIHAVEAEDHYLRVHTERGSDLILMRLSDAVAELDGLEGAQTHRSWWVARDAVAEVSRGDGRATLTLKGGQTVPVSRRHARALRAAGWW